MIGPGSIFGIAQAEQESNDDWFHGVFFDKSTGPIAAEFYPKPPHNYHLAPVENREIYWSNNQLIANTPNVDNLNLWIVT